MNQPVCSFIMGFLYDCVVQADGPENLPLNELDVDGGEEIESSGTVQILYCNKYLPVA